MKLRIGSEEEHWKIKRTNQFFEGGGGGRVKMFHFHVPLFRCHHLATLSTTLLSGNCCHWHELNQKSNDSLLGEGEAVNSYRP